MKTAIQPTRRLISRRGGKHGSLLCPVFSVGGFDTDQMATLKPLMMWRFPAVGSSAWLHIISKLGPTAGQAFPQWGPFHQPCIYSSLWLTPRPARGLCSVCQPCWEGSVAQRAVIHQASVCMCVCTCCTLLCFISRWGVSPEGTKWSQASCSNRPEEQALCDWGQCVNAGLCAAVGVRTCCMCARFITFSDTSSQDKLTPPWPRRPCKLLLTLPATSFIGLLFIWKHDSRLADTCTYNFHKSQFVLYVRLAHIHIEHLSVVLFPHPPTHGICPPSQCSVIDEPVLCLSGGLSAAENRALTQSLSYS